MIGCCSNSRVKFINADGKVDPERLKEIIKKSREDGLSEKGIAKTRECGCPCHIDGVACLC